jgi:2-dehydropantoate 2-reductase
MRIVVAGAGAIGCFTGGLLAAAGRDVTLLARPRVIDEVAAHGLTVTDYAGLNRAASPALSDDPAVLARADVILVTVKSGATETIAQEIAAHADAAAVVVSLQNGLKNAETLRRLLPERDVRAGMVPFNVVPKGGGVFHRASSGDIVIAAGPRDIAAVLDVPDLPVTASDEIEAIQWGKLVINLNNAVNALSGLTLERQLLDRDWRRVMAAQMAEAVRVLRRAGIRARPTTPVPMAAVPHILRLPTPLFRRIAAQMLTVDPEARASMSHDLAAGRRTEVDDLQGEIVARAKAAGTRAPIAAHIRALVHAAEAAGAGSPRLGPGALLP